MANIYLVGGSKGGVGKSLLSMALLDYLTSLGREILFVETDTSNPDTWKIYRDTVESKLINLDEADGWIELVNLCDTKPHNIVVINSAARSNQGIAAYAETLGNTLPELKRKLVTLWVINRQRDSLELLREYMQALPNTLVHVVRNLYFGAEAKFELYNSSKIRNEIESQGGQSLNFPDLADRVADDLYSQRLTIERALKELPIGNRAELSRWRRETHRMLEGILDE